METNISSTKNTILSKRDALRLLDIIHASLFCTSEKEFNRIVADVKTMVDSDPAAGLRKMMPECRLENIPLPFEGHTRTPRARVIFKHIEPHLRRTFTQLSGGGGVKKGNHGVSLTKREKEMLLWAKEGKGTWEIATILGISRDTVKFHMKNIFRKLNTTNRSQAIVAAFENGLIDL